MDEIDSVSRRCLPMKDQGGGWVDGVEEEVESQDGCSGEGLKKDRRRRRRGGLIYGRPAVFRRRARSFTVGGLE